MNMKEAALKLANEGFKVFPVNGKTPIISREDGGKGCLDATTNIDQINKWWDKYPSANIAIAPTEDFFVLDVDSPTGHKFNGFATLKELPELPPTLTAITGSGGYHYFYKKPAGAYVKNSNSGSMGEGIDVKTIGGYIVAAPSVHPTTKKPYQWILPKQPIVESPEWLIERLKPVEYVNGPIPTDIGPEEKVRKAAAYLKAIPPAIQGRAGDEATTNACRHIGVGFNLTWEEIAGSMLQWNATCVPPWKDDDLRKKFERVKLNSVLQPGFHLATKSPEVKLNPQLPNEFRIISIKEMKQIMNTKIEVLAPYIVAGCITEIDGHLKKGGKTIFGLSIAKALLNGDKIFGTQCVKTPVVYLNETPSPDLMAAIELTHFPQDNPDFGLGLYELAKGTTWPQRVETAVNDCIARKARVLFVDTWSQWIELRGDAENSAGSMAEALLPIQELALPKGIAVVILRHLNKAGNARGSTVISGAVSNIVEIKRFEEDECSPRRAIHYEGRHSSKFTDMFVELDVSTGEYRKINSPHSALIKNVESEILECLETPRQFKDLLALIGGKEENLREALEKLVETKTIKVEGKSRSKVTPLKYSLNDPLGF